jgi:hypothetical protein
MSDPARTIDVPTAGATYLGLKPKAAYLAAKRGDIPTLRIGKYLRVPVHAMEALIATPGWTPPKRGPKPGPRQARAQEADFSADAYCS